MSSFSSKDRKDLENNPNVLKVTTSNVAYTTDFKAKALRRRKEGATPQEVFREAGIDLSLFGESYAKKCLQRWEKMEKAAGGLNKERRGSKSTGRPRGLSFKSPEEEIAYLRAENDFLKKLRALEAKYANKKNSR